jgi:GH18 family chitinase
MGEMWGRGGGGKNTGMVDEKEMVLGDVQYSREWSQVQGEWKREEVSEENTKRECGKKKETGGK